jgi:tetratricopeptide (TPR) repeat protein
VDVHTEERRSPSIGRPGEDRLAALREAVDLLALERPAEAASRLETLVSADGSWAVARAYLGTAYLRLARVEDARVELEAAIEGEPASFICRVRHAEYLARMGFFDRAADELDVALRLPAPDAASRQDALMFRAMCARRSSGLYYRRTSLPRLPGPMKTVWRKFAARRAPSNSTVASV